MYIHISVYTKYVKYIKVVQKFYHFSELKGGTMKPEYNEHMLQWKVKGLGLFPTFREAKEAIADNEAEK